MPSLLAFATPTQRMSIALMHGPQSTARDAAAAAPASATSIPAALPSPPDPGIARSAVAATASAPGPVAFTGLRTACSVAQGLAFGADKPVLPIDTLLAVAEDARQGDARQTVWVVNDARMNEIYAAHYGHADG